MDPFIVGMVVLAGASAAAALRLRGRRAREAAPSPRALPAATETAQGDGAVRVGEVLTYLSDEYWLAGELALVREGQTAMRLFSAPERGRERWVALPRDGRALWVLYVDPALAALGWPGVEVPAAGRTLKRIEHGSVALVPAGEGTAEWEGMGRFALFRAHDAVAVVVHGPHGEQLALVGREIPWQLVQKMG
jgi:hypothetical protein